MNKYIDYAISLRDSDERRKRSWNTVIGKLAGSKWKIIDSNTVISSSSFSPFVVDAITTFGHLIGKDCFGNDIKLCFDGTWFIMSLVSYDNDKDENEKFNWLRDYLKINLSV